jgi:hypothetical protein
MLRLRQLRDEFFCPSPAVTVMGRFTRARVVWASSEHVGFCFLESNPGLVAAVTAMIARQRTSRAQA